MIKRSYFVQYVTEGNERIGSVLIQVSSIFSDIEKVFSYAKKHVDKLHPEGVAILHFYRVK